MSKGKKRAAIFLGIILFALTLMTLQHGKTSNPFTAAVTYPFNALNRFFFNLGDSAKNAWNCVDENNKLKNEHAVLLAERQHYTEIIQENIRLKEVLALRAQEHSFVTAAKVISKGYDRLLNLVIIDKGRKDGIEKGMAAITPKGLAGKIYSVKEDYSELLLLKDANFSAAVRLQNSRTEGVISGTGHSLCALNYIPPEENVEAGEVVVTSGLDGVFPPGLFVGVVGSIKKEGVEFFQHIEVMPFQSAAKLEEVVILKKAAARK
ncbi:MAG: rod shape-determining protein MreC [Nitrospirae bacterium]|nr:MAG: rod shape-determining protein MreC [Nitrospirota bacterium]